MISRQLTSDVKTLLQEFPAVALVGPRQVGKTTLVKNLSEKLKIRTVYFDLENDADLIRMENAPFVFSQYEDECIILDEVQLKPQLFRQLRPAIDQHRKPGRFILTGSASPGLIKGVSESLAGRIAFTELSPVNLIEAATSGISQKQHWFRGGFPNALTSKTDEAFTRWTGNFIKAYIERDLGALFGVSLSEVIIRNFWYMLAAQNGSIWSAESYARALGTSSPTVKRYLDFLEGAFMVRQLPAWFVNIGKRLVKAPKIYVRDSGLLHTLNRIRTAQELPLSLAVGGSWEGYVIEQISQIRPADLDIYYYRTHNGAECDLVLANGIVPQVAIEIKFSATPKLSRGFYSAVKDLNVKKSFVIVPGTERYLLEENVVVIGLHEFLAEIENLL